MQSSETRFINQCTYTPIAIKDDAQKLLIVRPFEILNLLTTIFNTPALMELLLKYIYEFQQKPEFNLPPKPSIEKIEAAAKQIWQGEVYTAVETIRDVDVDEVIAFTEGALKIEEVLFHQSLQDLDTACDSLSKLAEDKTASIGELRQEIEVLRQEVVSLRGAVAQPQQGRESIQQMVSVPSLLENQPTVRPEITKRAITLDTLEQHLAEVAKPSSVFLQAIQFFPLRSESFPLTRTSFAQPVSFMTISAALPKEAKSIQEKKQSTQSQIKNIKVAVPVGYLHLERMQFTPIGYQRGELVYSLPLLPKETVRLSHREWSRTEKEFEEIVSTSIENTSEESLSEKSELTQSTDTQQQHSSAHELDVHAEASYGTLKITSDYGFDCKESEQNSRKSSAKRSQDITKKAASRSKKDHKVTFKVTTEYGVEEESFREITNQSDKAIRWDFHRLMKKWRIDLYRYDARLTYDIVIPEPGNYLLRKYIFLKAIEDELRESNEFNIDPQSISREKWKIIPSRIEPSSGVHVAGTPLENVNYWETLSQKYGVPLDPPPKEYVWISVRVEESFSEQYLGNSFVDLTLPSGYVFDDFVNSSGISTGALSIQYPTSGYCVFDALFDENNYQLSRSLLATSSEKRSHFLWQYKYYWNTKDAKGEKSQFVINARGKSTEHGFKDWQSKCYEKLSDAAKAQYEAKQQKLKEMQDSLLDELDREDSLMLRKLEKEELMKGMIRWLLGPSFSFYPKDTLDLPAQKLQKSGIDEKQFIQDYKPLEFYDEATQKLKSKGYWESGLKYGEFIKFIHQAVEWENINYILYPYFWSDPDKELWDFKQSLFHKDHVHRAFLRAGTARVILPIRPGFEDAFLAFTEGNFNEAFKIFIEGGLEKVLGNKQHPYVTISQELENLAKTQYPYTPDANIEIEEYLFSWSKIPGDGAPVADDEAGRLKEVLSDDFYVAWINTPQPGNGGGVDPIHIEKKKVQGNDEETIIVSRNPDPTRSEPGGFASITLNTKDETAVIKISDSRTYALTVKKEGNDFKLYKKLNWIDTWYEFTPTGALDVVEGKVLDNE